MSTPTKVTPMLFEPILKPKVWGGRRLETYNKVLLQGREFGVGVMLASQYLSHFRTTHENYVEPLLTWLVHKVPNVTVKELESLWLPHVDSNTIQRIKSLECHECLYKTFDVDGQFIRATPFYELMRQQRGEE